MRHPWHALTQLLAEEDHDGSYEGRSIRLQEAWTETASRLGVTRLGWWAQPGSSEPNLAYPVPRALIRTVDPPWRDGDTLMARRRPSLCLGEDEVAITVDGTVLVAASAIGKLPGAPVLVEVATLALALIRQLQLQRRRESIQGRLDQADATAAAGHDLRNELTRALLFAGRGQEGDGAEVMRALGAARELAHSALLPPDGGAAAKRLATKNQWEPFELRVAVTEEVRAAAAAARAPEGFAPSVRLKCPKGLMALTDERLFRRALRNVVLNAMEASVRRRRLDGEARAVTVLVEVLDAVSASGFSVRLTVRDAGTGMGKEAVASFLEPRGGGGDRGDQRAVAGELASTGLGTASLAVALAAGEIPLRVESAVGRGTTVTLWLRTVAAPGAEALIEYVIDADGRRGRRRVEARRREAQGDVWLDGYGVRRKAANS